MSHQSGGTAQLAAAGSVERNGKFLYSNNAGTRLSGGITLDGQEAGYTFVRDVANGKFVGITRWVQ
jgi:hypothetical protein